MINKAIIIGNLGADPDLKTTNSGTPVCELRVATSDRFKSGDEWKERTEWHRVVVWGRTAENAAQYLAKGRRVYVEGRIQTREWEGQDGAKRYTTEIVAQVVKFLGGEGGNRSGGSHSAPQSQGPPSGGGGFDDSSIPF